MVFVLLMGVLIIFGNRGLVDNYMMKKKSLSLKTLNGEIYRNNRELEKRITLLRRDLSYIEMVARNELGMVRKGDIVYRYTR